MVAETTFSIAIPTAEDWEMIRYFIQLYKLDGTDLAAEQFLVCNNELSVPIGFGRIKKHSDCDEISSLGVLSEHRNKGNGRWIVEELIRLTTKEIFIVTVIPEYFAKLGFEKAARIPESIIGKLSQCQTTCGGDLPSVMTFKK